MSAPQAMRSAQSLYENGYITYMRTDTTTLSDTALDAARARDQPSATAPQYLPDAPRQYAKKVKNAQEAHEAIRPAGDAFRSPEEVAREVSPSEARVYELIWKRTIASQMTDATGETVDGAPRCHDRGRARRRVRRPAARSSPTRASCWPTSRTATRATRTPTSGSASCPALTEGDALDAHEHRADGHETQPPARFTEASLVKRLEELGVGRPSTYASIMGTIQDRGYVWKKGTALVPVVHRVRGRHVARAALPRPGRLRVHRSHGGRPRRHRQRRRRAGARGSTDFYFGPPTATAQRTGGLKELVSDRLDEIDAAPSTRSRSASTPNGMLIVAKPGRDTAPTSSAATTRASIPDDLAPDELTVEQGARAARRAQGRPRARRRSRPPGCPSTPRAAGSAPTCSSASSTTTPKAKPKTASLFQTMTLETVTLDDALRAAVAAAGRRRRSRAASEIIAQNGKFGPVPQEGHRQHAAARRPRSSSSRVTLDEAVALFAEPKRAPRSGAPSRRCASSAPIPVSGKPMVVKDGRFGPYVTDGETNASLRKGDEVETITDERAAELLQDRRDRGPGQEAGVEEDGHEAKKKAGAKKTGHDEEGRRPRKRRRRRRAVPEAGRAARRRLRPDPTARSDRGTASAPATVPENALVGALTSRARGGD